MRIRPDHRRIARCLWHLCLDHGVPKPEFVRQVAEGLMTNRNRQAKSVLAAFTDMLRRHVRLQTVRVLSPIPLARQEQDSILQRLSTCHEAGPNVQFVIRPELIAGLCIEIGYDRFDGSFQGKLLRLQRILASDGTM